ncbi:MAG TPA: hypothetical protein VLK82_04160 [Candidatus Tectomicrobia bacterium]|nr:hypothetical protein [Candidatus Tectomicrobia bacterium]
MNMKRTLMIVALLTALTIPVIAGADDQGWMPPEWTPTPPARPMVDLVRLVQLLEAKGVISDQDYALLTRPQSSSPSQPGHGRVWTWNEIDNNPVLRAGRSGGD